MPLVVRFQPIRLAGQYDGEDGWLGLANDHIVAVLVQAAVEEGVSNACFLECGFGPCRGEGRLFPTLGSAETWIRDQISESWLVATAPGSEPNGAK